MIYFDDLNDYIGQMGGHPQSSTPNIDALAGQGVSFLNAHTSAPGCGPSRTSMMSGKDCQYTGVLNNAEAAANFRYLFSAENGNELVYTFPELLKDSGGYFTIGIGKIFHGELENDFDNGASFSDCDNPYSWNRMIEFEEEPDFQAQTLSYAAYPTIGWGIIPDSLEPGLEDYQTTDYGIDFINEYASGSMETCGSEAFMLVLGYERPHTPRMLPEKYFLPWYLDSLEEGVFQSPINNLLNDSSYNGLVMPPQPDVLYGDYLAFEPSSLSREFADFSSIYPALIEYLGSIPDLPLLADSLDASENYDLNMQYQIANYVMSYLAAANYLDTQVGRVVEALQAYPDLYENTIFVITSDHGYALGEKKHFSKWALWETDLRVPLIIGGPAAPGTGICNQPVSLLDVFPTLLELGGVDPASIADGNYLDGRSLMPLLQNPSLAINKPSLASTQRNGGGGSCFSQYSVRDQEYHLIRYKYNNELGESSYCDSASNNYDYELYHLGSQRQVDPNEWNNLANDERFLKLRDYLESFMPDGSHYLQSQYSTIFQPIGSMGCFLENSGPLRLRAYLFDPDGQQLTAPEAAAYQFTWSNNANELIRTGVSFNFNLASIPADFYLGNDSLFIYLTVTDPLSGDTIAFHQEVYYINPVNTPLVTFDASLTGRDLQVSGLSITGTYTSTSWEFGDGGNSNSFLPLEHTYLTDGAFNLTHTVEYGNGCNVQDIRTLYIQSQDLTTCSGDTILLPDGTGVADTGTYITQLSTVAGEDSVIITSLSFSDVTPTIQEYILCSEESVLLPDGTTSSGYGTFLYTLTASGGCDSLVEVHIIPADTSFIEITRSICGTGSVTVGGVTYTETGVYTISYVTAEGCVTTAELTITDCGGGRLGSVEPKVYPNPAYNMLYVETGKEQSALLRLYNSYGEQVLQQQTETSLTSMDISMLPTGLYTLEITAGSSRSSISVVITR